jgi:hypothetical protein
MCKWRLLILGSISVILASCADNGMMEDKNPDRVYATYVVTGKEGKEFVTIVVQFHSGRPDKPGILLNEPSVILLDDQPMVSDSARESGVFYELQLPTEEFEGKHIIRFIDESGREHKEEFVFTPLQLAKEVPETVNRQGLFLTFKGLTEKHPVRVVMMDTSINGEGINEIDTIVNNRLDLTKFSGMLTKGPIMLQLFSEQERWLKSYEGEISITYTLKREFELKD